MKHPLLAIWEINKGEKLPSNIMAFVRKTILKKGSQDVEVKEREYSLTFKSSTSPTGSRNHLASFRFQNTFR
jgi:hypothetical protein